MASTPPIPPPHYSASTSSASATLLTSPLDNFFDIVPQSDATSFQVGYLGLEGFQAWIRGDVLIKLDERANQERNAYKQCTITLIAEEVDQQQSIPFFSATQLLWQNASTSTPNSPSSSSAIHSTSDFAPSTMPFSFQLTSDLPHCIHLPSSSLEYRLEATLQSGDENMVPTSFKKTLVHLTRYSRPGSLDRNEAVPHIWHIDTPTPMTVQLHRTLFRRAEPISVHITIPPPDKKLLSLNLRSVEANLYRVIENHEKHELLLAHSGKLCRFHSTRSIVLRLALHPPFDSSNMPYPHPDHDAALSGPVYGRGGGGGCESVSQETLLHKVSFLVKILIGIRGEGSERRDVVLQREIQVLPGAAGGLDIEESKVNNKKAEAEQSTGEAGPSNLTSTSTMVDFGEEEEEEYDGYEDVGRPLTDEGSGEEEVAAAEAILHDQDAPPPTLLESRHDLQVEVEVAGEGAGVPRSPSAEEADYVWRQEDQSGSSGNRQEDLLPPPPTPPVEEQENHQEAETIGVHRPPPYVAESLRARPTRAPLQDDAHPPAYPHTPISSYAVTPHPPSYEA